MIYALFFLSGISALIYQVVWVREFGRIFGNTIHSATVVTAVFMAGLGLGSYVVGAYVDRRHGASRRIGLLVYGVSEVLIAGLGLAVAWILPQLESWSAATSRWLPMPSRPNFP